MQDISELYSSFTNDAADEASDTLASGWFKWADGMNRVRALPATPGQSLPWVIAHVHAFTDPETGEFTSFNCPRSTPGDHDKYCLGCEHIEHLMKSSHGGDRKFAEEMAVAAQGFMKVIDRNAERRGIQTVRLSPGIMKRLIEFRNSPMFSTDFTDPIKGFDIFVEKKIVGGRTKYTAELSREPSPLAQTDEQTIQWLQDSIAKPIAQLAAPTLIDGQRERVKFFSGAALRQQLQAPPNTIDTEASAPDDDIPY